MGIEAQIPEGNGVKVSFPEAGDGIKVVQALGHLAPIHLQEFPMQPVSNPSFAGQSFGLGNFVLMVDGHVIDAAGVNVNFPA